MSEEIRSAIDFYERHPISAQIILAKLETARGHLDDLRPEDLFAHDQDHYGGLAANDALAGRAHIREDAKVADFCAGLGGPARYFAHRYGAVVTGIELTPSRVHGAQDLTQRVGLQGRVQIIEGNVMDAPLADASQDAVISQEAFLHVPDLERVFAEAHRVLRIGGRFAYTNWTVDRPLSAADEALMWQGMAVQPQHGAEAQATLLRRAGFDVLQVEDLTEEWGHILTRRLAMYRELRGEAQRAGAPAGHDAFYESYVRFVELVNRREIGGGRFTSIKTQAS